MRRRETDTHNPQCHDKQLREVSLEAVLEKRRLGQALNAKEFSVCAGVSYSTARHWFHLPGFPVFQGFVFWQDFVNWRAIQTSQTQATNELHDDAARPSFQSSDFPSRAARILSEAKDGAAKTTH